MQCRNIYYIYIHVYKDLSELYIYTYIAYSVKQSKELVGTYRLYLDYGVKDTYCKSAETNKYSYKNLETNEDENKNLICYKQTH